MPQSREASDLPSTGCCSAFWALLSLARGFIRQHVAWSRSSVMDVVAATDLSFGPSNTSSGLERSEPEAAAAAVRIGQDGVSMHLPIGSVESLHPDVVSGLVHLHHLGIIHRDLITKEFCAKLSDMGSSKVLLGDTSSSGYHVADCGGSRSQAPEQLCNAHQTCSVDVFGLNHVSFICITGRRHPFGESLKGDRNIEENVMDLSSVEFMPEAADLFTFLQRPDPYLRPKALEHACLEDAGRLGNCRDDDEADPNLKVLSKKKKQGKSRKINQSLDNKDERGSLENDDRISDCWSYDESDSSLKMPSQMKIHVSIECDGSLNKKDEHAPSEIDGKLDTNRINDESQSKLKVPCWIRKTHESGKRNDSPDRKDEHVSSEKEDRHGNSRSGDQGDFYLKTLSKRKKSCESGQSNGGLGKKEHHVISENEGGPDNSVGNDDAWMNLEKPAGGGTPGCWIGKLFVSNTEIAKGSKGTIILEGFYEGRPVAVKRLTRAHHYVASQEIQSLRASDRDPNIVRLYGVENDQNFMYLALERCACSLDDLIRAHSNSSEKSVFPDDLASNAIIEYRIRLDSVKGTTQDVNLWREDGHPSPLLLKLMSFYQSGHNCQPMSSSRVSVSSCCLINYRDVISGLVHLHHLGIIHRDLKPQSVLITKELCAKLSDMGSSQRLPKDTSPSGYHVPNCGTLALHTPEQLSPAHQMCSVDLFGLGCILFFCITGGKHPFGDGLKGDNNIKEYSIDLSPVEFLPEAADLFARLLNPNPNLRPKALEVLHHPLIWNSKTRLSFLRDASDWVELKARRTNSDLMEKLESIAQQVFDEEWNGKIDCKVIKHMRRFRVYKFEKARDLLRIVRNTFCHAIGLPWKIQEIVGSSPEDMDSYFVKRFPRLLIETYRFVSMCCKDDERFPFPEYFSW
ncbi:serine/threonine-protein kinase/endoribonuclease IRE1b isoform X2 [Eucalyptus grandis]|uniref:serine/threonine-protein kinase/endoribonuclease IRE1b isoform X2 n=1 Tax=Eucalyptus grandis TaxID=71139 RepID=UPI00192ED208|nr:serine/threonine-protein kinase/endoribonuclease IRE1b isoform X2 [Eucalyptus grandis]